MKKWMSFVTFVALVSIVAWGCGGGPQVPVSPTKIKDKKKDGEEEAHGHDHGDETLHVSYCGDCGFAKGSDQCCEEGATKCSKCNLTAGSTLCCKLEGDYSGKVLCGQCGDVGGTTSCCKADAEKCAKCDLQKGSVLCCKVGDSDS